MANPQAGNGFLRIANEIWNEVIRRDFSKRQKDIILFIWRLSYGCKKKSAYIPQLKDFELCGVGPTNVTKEIHYLVSCKVINWDKVGSVFTVNKDYERWQISPVKGWNEKRFKQLIHENLDKNGYQNDKSDSELFGPKIVVTYQNNKLRLIKTISFRLLKREVGRGSNPYGSKAKRLSKDSIKDSIKDIKDSQEEEEPQTALDAYRFSFNKFMYTGFIQGYVSELLKRGYPDSFVREVFLDMGARGIGPDERYMRKLAEDWILKGISSRQQANQNKVTPFIPKANTSIGVGEQPARRSKYEQEMDELQQAREEAKRLEAIGSD